MLLLASLVYLSSHWQVAPSCPSSFTSVDSTIGALSDSSSLQICVAKSVLVKGSDGSIKLVIGANSSAPSCLVYPNGLSPDLSFDLIQSGHLGCWSLYPPYQSVTIVNLTKPSTQKLVTAFKTFRPLQPKIFFKPNRTVQLGESVLLYSWAVNQNIKGKLLNLPVEVRFKPITYKWSIKFPDLSSTKFSSPKPTFIGRSEGEHLANLSVGYTLEYAFPALTAWSFVKPNILLIAAQKALQVESQPEPQPSFLPPRLVDGPCRANSTSWGC